MDITVKQHNLLQALQWVSGVSDKKHALPILGNVLIIAEDQKISLICSDLELEMITTIKEGVVNKTGEITVSSRKLLDICRSLPESAEINCVVDGDRIILRAGRSRFMVASLPAADFPVVQLSSQEQSYLLNQKVLHDMIARTHFAMAQQDVRYYLNGMLFVFNQSLHRVVATDGHRLAITKTLDNQNDSGSEAIIVPRKAITELSRLIGGEPLELKVDVEKNHVRFIHPHFTLTSKLIEGRFPDYNKVIPPQGLHQALIAIEPLKQSLSRVSILSNEKHKGVRFLFNPHSLVIEAHNPEQEEAEEALEMDYDGPAFEIGFNAHYILDVLNVLPPGNVVFSFSDPKDSVLLRSHTESAQSTSQYVVMPLRL
ncbi:MAG TPA: DNA polymerase III subunit beta [Gammaproteobacteria bacterium]|nr:DNA polymerase III subunit beta [Gammaproteobacteria bacterium]